MARIAGVDIPRDKQVSTSLTYIYGIGPSRSQEILSQAGIDPETRVKDLSEVDVTRLRQIIDNDYTVEGDLRREVAMNIKRPVVVVVVVRRSKSGGSRTAVRFLAGDTVSAPLR